MTSADRGDVNKAERNLSVPVNRALFSFICKFRKLKDSNLHGKVKNLVDKSGFAIRARVVQTYRLFIPKDIEWVVAS